MIFFAMTPSSVRTKSPVESISSLPAGANLKESLSNFSSPKKFSFKIKESEDLNQLALGLVKKFERLQVLNKKELNDTSTSLKNLKDPIQIANNISSNLNIQIFEKQELLEIIDLKKRPNTPFKNSGYYNLFFIISFEIWNATLEIV